MNIEEEGYSGPLMAAGSLCGYIHLSESNRGLPGEGTVDWEDVFGGLKAISYTGPLVLEAFASGNPDLVGAACLWHPSKYGPKELATRGLEFLKKNAKQAGLE
jgi:D-psicose/D-tagatose/L-ribulose 3-epimerase